MHRPELQSGLEVDVGERVVLRVATKHSPGNESIDQASEIRRPPKAEHGQLLQRKDMQRLWTSHEESDPIKQVD